MKTLGSSTELHFDWVRPFLDGLLRRWLAVAEAPNGLFYPHLDREWRRREGGHCTLVSQSRLIYNFCRAYQLNGDAAYAEAATRGLSSLEKHFRHADGGWIWSCEPDGRARDEFFDSYGHAFVILAFATAASVLKRDAYRERALETWSWAKGHFRDRFGGLVRRLDGAEQPAAALRSQNPMMHTFEALLALAAQAEDAGVRRDALDIWTFLGQRLREEGLPEWYDSEWRVLETGERAGFDIGHQFEWAFLLSEADALGLGDGLLTPARGLLRFGLAKGHDAREGGIVSPVGLDGRPRNARKGFWEQCEAIRALARFAGRHGCLECPGPLAQCVGFARARFEDPEFGGWYIAPPGTGAQVNLDKGSAWKLDYHVTNMCLELLRYESPSLPLPTTREG